MKEYLSIGPEKRQEIIKKIKDVLENNKNIVFAFIYGSFLGSLSFRDIDIGVYIDNSKKDEIFDDELKLSKEIADGCGLPFDIIEVKILNLAPNYFLNNIFTHGKLLFSRDKKLLSNLIENTSLDALVNEYIIYQSLKELVPVK